MAIFIPIFQLKVERARIVSMDGEARKMMFIVLLILGAGVGFYLARFLF